MYMDDKKRKWIGNSDTSNKYIQLGYRNGIWDRKMCQDDNETWKETNNGSKRTAKSKMNRTLWEKEDDKYLGILEADTIKREEMKEISEEYLRRTKKLIGSKPHHRFLTKEQIRIYLENETLARKILYFISSLYCWKIKENNEDAVRISRWFNGSLNKGCLKSHRKGERNSYWVEKES